MSLKEDILQYLDHGVFTAKETKEIASYIGCSERYVQKVVKEFNSQNPANQLTIENYIKAILSGIDTKQKLAEFLGVSRMSLHRFEKNKISTKKISRYLYIAGVDINAICHLYRLAEKEKAELLKLPTINRVKNELQIISATLHPFKSSCKEIDEQHSNINKILWRL